MEVECLSPYTPMSTKTAIRKDFFIQSRKEDIKTIYKFHHKVFTDLFSLSEEVVMEQFIKPH